MPDYHNATSHGSSRQYNGDVQDGSSNTYINKTYFGTLLSDVYQYSDSRAFRRFLFGVDKIIECLKSFTIQFPGDTEADRLEAIVRAKNLKIILVKVEKEIDSSLDDNMQLQGRHNL